MSEKHNPTSLPSILPFIIIKAGFNRSLGMFPLIHSKVDPFLFTLFFIFVLIHFIHPISCPISLSFTLHCLFTHLSTNHIKAFSPLSVHPSIHPSIPVRLEELHNPDVYLCSRMSQAILIFPAVFSLSVIAASCFVLCQ